MAMGVLSFIRCSSSRQAAQHSFPTVVGEDFHHETLDLGSVSVTDWFCSILFFLFLSGRTKKNPWLLMVVGQGFLVYLFIYLLIHKYQLFFPSYSSPSMKEYIGVPSERPVVL